MDVAFYIEGVRELMLQNTRLDFDKLYLKKKKGYTNNFGTVIPGWKEPFIQYFENNILPDIESIAKFSILPICGDYFNEFTGITTNHGEGLNNLYKLLLERTSMPLDIVVLCFFHLSIYYSNEIKLGFANNGNYRLKSEFHKYAIPRSMILTRATTNPATLIQDLLKNPDDFQKISCVVDNSVVQIDESDKPNRIQF